MATMITEVYEAFKDAKVGDEKAIAAAQAIVDKDNAATKADILRLEARMEQLESKLTIRLGGMLVLAVGAVVGLVKFLCIFNMRGFCFCALIAFYF